MALIPESSLKAGVVVEADTVSPLREGLHLWMPADNHMQGVPSKELADFSRHRF